MTILITGSNGGVGSRLVKHLLEGGARDLACHYRSASDEVAQLLRKADPDPDKHPFPAGLIGLTKALALELANKSITVNAVALGYFNCGLLEDIPVELHAQIKARIPIGRFGEGSDVGSTVKLLLDRESAFLTGQVIHLNG